MTINVTENGYYVGIWILNADTGDNFMGALYREEGAQGLIFKYRFRWRRDDKVFDSADEKRWVTADFSKKTEDDAIAIVDGIVFEAVRNGFLNGGRPSAGVSPFVADDRVQRVLVRGDGHAFLAAMQRMQNLHTRRADAPVVPGADTLKRPDPDDEGGS